MADIVTSQVFSDGEKGITAAKMNNIVAGSVIQPAFYTAKPSSPTLDPTDVLLEVKGTGAYAQITGSQLINSVGTNIWSTIQPQVWATRLRSFNALGNPTFEVDQRQAGASVGIGAVGSAIDRWWSVKAPAATMTGTVQQMVASPPVLLPGTNFALTSKFWRVTLSAQQTTLAATDYHSLISYPEGPQWRELMSDVHSVQILVRSSVAGLSFGLALKDPATSTKTLTKLCTITTANSWTLIPLPNLPVWPSGNFVNTPGSNGYQLLITLASGSTNTSPANDVWQNGAFFGAAGQSNFAASPVNSTFDIAFAQHEPGSLCTTPIDKPFAQNLDECLRYYTKSYPYATAAGAVSNLGMINAFFFANQSPLCYVPFKKTMAKAPTVTGYSNSTGAANNVRDGTASLDKAISSASAVGDSSFSGFTITPNTVNWNGQFHYVADTGW